MADEDLSEVLKRRIKARSRDPNGPPEVPRRDLEERVKSIVSSALGSAESTVNDVSAEFAARGEALSESHFRAENHALESVFRQVAARILGMIHRSGGSFDMHERILSEQALQLGDELYARFGGMRLGSPGGESTLDELNVSLGQAYADLMNDFQCGRIGALGDWGSSYRASGYAKSEDQTDSPQLGAADASSLGLEEGSAITQAVNALLSDRRLQNLDSERRELLEDAARMIRFELMTDTVTRRSITRRMNRLVQLAETLGVSAIAAGVRDMIDKSGIQQSP